MTVRERFERLAGVAARRPVLTVGVVLGLAMAGAVVSLGLEPSAGTDTFVSRSSVGYRATAEDQRHFGADPVIILIHESLPDLVETRDLARVTQLEACLAGQYVVADASLRAFTPAPAGTHTPYGGWASPCGKLMRLQPAQVVYGPGTFLNRAVAAVNTQIQAMMSGLTESVRRAESGAYQLGVGRGLTSRQALAAANAAGRLEYQQQLQSLERLALSTGITSLPSIDSPQFIPEIVFDQTRGVNQPKARFAYLFPSKSSALIQVRLKASLSDAQQARAISLIRQAIALPMFRSAYGGTYTVSGVPVLLSELATQITGSIARLLIAAIVVMAATLLIVFRSPRRPGGESSGALRLLPLAIALLAAGITFGLLAVLGAALTMASIAVLPILIGLAVDYGIQFQARVEEARRAAASEGQGEIAAAQAVAQATGRTAPTLAAAALATATGFLVLLLSPVPMVHGFGLLLVVGIAVSLACVLTAGSAVLVLAERDLGLVGASWRGAGEILADGRRLILAALPRLGSWTPDSLTPARRTGPLLTAVMRRPGRVLVLAAVLALSGWVAGTQTAVQSDVTKLVPSGLPALRHLRTLEAVTGVSGEIDILVRGANVATPRTVGWMIGYENALLSHYGYVEERGCASSTLCPALSLPDLFSSDGRSSSRLGLTQTQINQLLAAVPAYFSQAVISRDHHEATLAFGLRLMALSRQQTVINYMRSHLHPPSGVSAQLTGLPVLAAQADAALSSSGQRLMTLLAGLAAVGLVLALVFGTMRRAFVPLIPIALATGWSALILFLIGIPLNPMSATLGTLVIAISTEFSVLLSERFGQERAAGYDLPTALTRTYRSTAVAVMASGITAIVGFGVLIFSNITMLRDFGFVTLVDLSVSLGGVLIVLPAVLALFEPRHAREPAWPVLRGAADRITRLKRRTRVA